MALPKLDVPIYQLTLPSNNKEISYRPFLVKEEKILLMAMEGDDQIEMINARRNVLTNTIESMGKAIEDLESSLVTARYFIFLGSMCGFLLGIACLFLVV